MPSRVIKLASSSATVSEATQKIGDRREKREEGEERQRRGSRPAWDNGSGTKTQSRQGLKARGSGELQAALQICHRILPGEALRVTNPRSYPICYLRFPISAASTVKTSFNRFALAAGLLTLAFAGVLWRLFTFAIADDLFSYIPLMPLVSAYLAWTFRADLSRRTQEPADLSRRSQAQAELSHQSSPALFLSGLFFAASAAALAGYFLLARTATPATVENSLAVGTLAWLLSLAGAGCWLLGGATMRALAFPFGLLLFMIPFPVGLRAGLEAVLQHGSAEAVDWMFVLSGTPVLRNGLEFQLSDISLQVAPECSGIHSTWVLFITSLVAGRLILRRPWKRALLCLAVLPLALLRNGFRVFVLGQLCIHVSPQMIDSPIHHRGGPVFFVLSLVPFFLLLYFLRKSEGAAGPPAGAVNDSGELL